MNDDEETGINRFAGLEFLAVYAIAVSICGLIVVAVYASAAWFFECIG